MKALLASLAIVLAVGVGYDTTMLASKVNASVHDALVRSIWSFIDGIRIVVATGDHPLASDYGRFPALPDSLPVPADSPSWVLPELNSGLLRPLALIDPYAGSLIVLPLR